MDQYRVTWWFTSGYYLAYMAQGNGTVKTGIRPLPESMLINRELYVPENMYFLNCIIGSNICSQEITFENAACKIGCLVFGPGNVNHNILWRHLTAHVNSLWPSYGIRHQRSLFSLARQWLHTCPAPNHHLNHCWFFFAKWAFKDKLQWNLNQNIIHIIQNQTIHFKLSDANCRQCRTGTNALKQPVAVS